MKPVNEPVPYWMEKSIMERKEEFREERRTNTQTHKTFISLTSAILDIGLGFAAVVGAMEVACNVKV
jgi:hypothetical protein